MGGFLPPAERRGSALMALYAALSLILLLMGDRIPVSALRAAGAWIFAPFDRVVLMGDRMLTAWRDHGTLRARVAELELERERLVLAGLENDKLRAMLDLPRTPYGDLRPAEVLALSGEPLPAAATLSVGRRHGVSDGNVVVTEDGLLGRIGETYGGLSRAVLITDPNSAVACEVESTGVLGVLRYVTTPRPRLLLTGISPSDSVRVGQRLLTSGMSRRYPRGLPVGTLSRIHHDGGLTQDVEVTPAARLSRLRHAFVLVSAREPLP
jgi:rod shape-determining protein MreC